MRRDGCGRRNFCGAGVESQFPLRWQSCLLRVNCVSPCVCVCVCVCVCTWLCWCLESWGHWSHEKNVSGYHNSISGCTRAQVPLLIFLDVDHTVPWLLCTLTSRHECMCRHTGINTSDGLELSHRQNFCFPLVPSGVQAGGLCSIKNLVHERSFHSFYPLQRGITTIILGRAYSGNREWGQGAKIGWAFLLWKYVLVNKVEIFSGLNNDWVYVVILKENF